jgi:hypothetical protein
MRSGIRAKQPLPSTPSAQRTSDLRSTMANSTATGTATTTGAAPTENPDLSGFCEARSAVRWPAS